MPVPRGERRPRPVSSHRSEAPRCVRSPFAPTVLSTNEPFEFLTDGKLDGTGAQVHFGLQLPYVVPATREELLTWSRRAEAGPFHTLSIGERVTFDNPDPIVALSAAAAITQDIRLLTNVTITLLHPTALLAKSFATLDRLCAGRLIVTPAVGSRAEDFAAVQCGYERRWQRLDDDVRQLQQLWRGEPAADCTAPVGPPPFRNGGPTLHCGARGPRALVRAVQWAKGYQGFTLDGGLEPMIETIEAVTTAFATAGKPRPELGVSCFFALGPDALNRLRTSVGRYFAIAEPARAAAGVAALTVSSPSAVRYAIDNAQKAGFDEIHFLPTITDEREIDRLEAVLSQV
jgi:alkanesulfonate monooxygenase SsuD/methylene tetrahydromethanopterin reductase-like flavin-dependent oxidoreductase (luciferase family)